MVRSLPAPLAPLTARLEALQLGSEEIGAITAYLPAAPLASLPTGDQEVALNLGYYNLGTLRVAKETVSSIRTLWGEGLLTAVPLQARLLFELWGASSFTQKLAAGLRGGRDDIDIADLAARLVAGTRSPPLLGEGGEANLTSVHVMDFVRSIEASPGGASDDYDFLSEACHPNYLQQTYVWMAGAAGDNWNSERFADYALGILTRLVDLTEASLAGIKQASRAVERDLAPYF